MNRTRSNQNGVPVYNDAPYVNWNGMYSDFNPYIPVTFNHPRPAPPPVSLCLLLNSSENKPCSTKQATQACRTVLTDKGLICSGLGGIVDIKKGTTTAQCPIQE